MKVFKTLLYFFLFVSLLFFPGCELIGDIFGAGVWVGIIISALVVALIIFILVKIFKKLRK